MTKFARLISWIGHPLVFVLASVASVVGTQLGLRTGLPILLALLLNKPVIAISFHHKCASLMRKMNLSEYCHEIHQMDTQRLITQFRELERNREAVRRTISHGVDEARVALDEQYDLLFARGVRGTSKD